MERLTPKGLGKTISIPINKKTLYVAYAMRLAELEDKLESGQLVELPCKVGDTVYGISPLPLHIETAKLSEICYEVVTKDGHHLIGYLGISLFTDKSQAKARLKELQELKNG